MELTVDGGGGSSGLSDAALELDLHALLLRELFVASKALLVDPLLEGLADEGVDDVADVRPGHLPDLPHDRKGSLDSRIGEAEVEDEVQGEVLVLGHSDDPYVFAGDGLKKVRIRKRDLQSCLRRQGPSCARW